MANAEAPLTYATSGVSYDGLDTFKRQALAAGRLTAANLHRFGYEIVDETWGESAIVWDEGEHYKATLIEGLGTKSLAADEVAKLGNETYYHSVGVDTGAMIFNDLTSVGARAQVAMAHFAVADASWFDNPQRTGDLIDGFASSCMQAGAVWGGGETPALRGVIEPGVIELSGSAVGEISPKNRITLGSKLRPGDAILLLGSSGIHANGLTLARTIADGLPDGYATRLEDGTTYGEALLTPTIIYARAVEAVYQAGVDIHYMSNITGHGWRKIMRANREDLAYRITALPEPQAIFKFIHAQTGSNDRESYGNLNMGSGYALFMPRSDVDKAREAIGALDQDISTLDAGGVESGQKQVILEPLGISFAGDTLNIR